jgi:uncharacterized membrane protein
MLAATFTILIGMALRLKSHHVIVVTETILIRSMQSCIRNVFCIPSRFDRKISHLCQKVRVLETT